MGEGASRDSKGQVGAENRTWSFSGLSATCSQRQLALWSGINCTFAYQLVNMDGPFAGAIILQYPVSTELAGYAVCQIK